MTIKHLVLCGGGPVGLVTYGVLKELTISKIIKYENIKSIYATSIGSFIALIYILNMNWEWIDDYLIKRPWDKMINFTSYDYLNVMYSKGLADEELIIEMVKPLLLAKDLDIDITMEEFYNITKIDLHLFTSNLNKFCKVDLNYKTYPSLKISQAIMMSSSIPVLIKPPYYNNEYYLDGGIFCNSPVNDCYNNEKCKKNEIFAIIHDKRYPIDENNEYYNNNNLLSNTNNLTENTNLFDFLIIIIKTILNKIIIFENENLIEINNSINVCLSKNNFYFKYWKFVLSNQDERIHLINLGKIQVEKYIHNNNIFDTSNNYLN
tara:strand:- start:3104 stop:4063 length:960 start_codon:yes stop_codon:yes gene_type:complete